MKVDKEQNIDYLKALAKRDEIGIKALYQNMLPKVYGYIKKEGGSLENAREMLNQAVFSIISRLDAGSLGSIENFEAYLFTSCKFLWKKEIKKNIQKRVTNEDVKHMYYDSQQQVDNMMMTERYDLFREKLEQMSENCKRILSLFFEKMSGKEMMQKLGYASETVVRQRIFKCKSKLSKLVKADARFQSLKA